MGPGLIWTTWPRTSNSAHFSTSTLASSRSSSSRTVCGPSPGLSRVLGGSLKPLMFLGATVALRISVSGSDVEAFALNEVVVERASAGHMVRLRTYVNDDEYLTYSADGVMVSTPTGSTGYNFSAGGPVVEATLPVMILTPVAPHFTIDRSIVVGHDKVIRLMADDKPAIIVADGRMIGALEAGQSVEVRQSPMPVRVVATRSFDLAFRLHEGLREGHA